MSVRFAGSRSLDERRRRRMAGDHADFTAPVVREPVRNSDAVETTDAVDGTEVEDVFVEEAPRLPTMPFFPAKGWKIGLVACGLVLLAVACPVAGWFAETHAATLGPAFASLFDLEHGSVPRLLSCLMLLVAGQLAVAVWWARSTSTRDFSGRYDVWLWAAGGWVVLGLAVGLEANVAWMQYVESSWAPRFRNKAVLFWLAPTIGAGAVLWSAVVGDMRRCATSRGLMWLAALCWLATGAFELGLAGKHLGRFDTLVAASVAITGHALGCIAMLVHARFVVHVDNDPPATRTAPKSVWEDDAEKTDADSAGSITATETPRTQTAHTAHTDDSSRATIIPTPTVPSPGLDAPEPAADFEPSPASPTLPERSDRVDPPHTEPVEAVAETAGENESLDESANGVGDDGPPAEMLRGLSKRQKRKVRKEWKDRQRLAAS